MMDILILTFLLIIVILLLKEKVVINNFVGSNSLKFQDPKDIMGKPKHIERQSEPKMDIESHKDEQKRIESKFETRTEGKGFNHPVSEQNSPVVPTEDNIDLEEEEEEFKRIGVTGHRGYAKGVSFQELYSAKQLLQKDDLKPALLGKAVVLVQKIQGTELFSLFDNSLDGSSRKIADLLDKNLPDESDPISFDSSDDFDIGKFV